MSLELSELFSTTRLPGGIWGLAICLYLPLGLSLLILRLAISCFVLPLLYFIPSETSFKRFLWRVYYFFIGICCSVEEHDKINSKILVSNHVTEFDAAIIDLLIGPVKALKHTSLSHSSCGILGIEQFCSKTSERQYTEAAVQYTRVSKTRILTFPENDVTNGKRGLLKFSPWVFSLHEAIQPIVLVAHRQPLFRVAQTTLTSTWLNDMFWILILPMTYYKIRVLSAIVPLTDESEEEFAFRTQTLMAAELGVEPTAHTCSDKAELRKRTLHTPSPCQTRTTEVPVKSDSRLEGLLEQVKLVLPDQPEHVIRRDLKKTGSVDQTIANILEGRADVSPPPQPVVPKPQRFTSLASAPSLHERKQALYELGRQIYQRRKLKQTTP